MIAVHDLIDAATVGDTRLAVFLRDQCFMTIVALAITLMSASSFAASAAAVFEDAQHGAGEASQR